MGHTKGPTPLQFDKKCSHGILTWVLKQKQSKVMEIQFYWICDRYKEQKLFHTHWKCGEHNLVEYPTKNHPDKYHRTPPPLYVSNSAKFFNKFIATVINKLQSVCKGVLNTNPLRKQVLQNRQTKQTDKQTHNYQTSLPGLLNPIHST